MKRISIAERAAGTKSLAVPAILVTLLLTVSCVAAIPVAIKYARSASQTTARAEMPVPADKVYRTALEMVQEKGVQILQRDDDKRFLEVTDGVQTGSLKAEAVGSDKTEITVVANVPSKKGEEKAHRKEKEKELTLRMVNRLCERLEVKCTIIKE